MSKRPDRPDVTRQPVEGPEPKKPRKDEQSDHVVAMTQLREEIASLQRQLQLKNQQMLGKDKEVLAAPTTGHVSLTTLRGAPMILSCPVSVETHRHVSFL